MIYVIVNAKKFGFLLFSKITQSQHDPAAVKPWCLELGWIEYHEWLELI
jgi:hypothetical protein